jgi:probable rRNA maturation factor
MNVTVRDAQRKVQVNRTALQQFATRALQLVLATRSPAASVLSSLKEVAVILVSDRRIAELHQQFMNIAGPTDVITFQHGEIFISTETAAQNAQQFSTSTAAELQLYIVHGLLHLHGFDDKSAAKSRAMEREQQRIAAAAQV